MVEERYRKIARELYRQCKGSMAKGNEDLFVSQAALVLQHSHDPSADVPLSRTERWLAHTRPHLWVPIGLGFVWGVLNLGFIWSLAPDLKGQLDLVVGAVLVFSAFHEAVGYCFGWYQGRRDVVRRIARREMKLLEAARHG
jgi:hypothetical protein